MHRVVVSRIADIVRADKMEDDPFAELEEFEEDFGFTWPHDIVLACFQALKNFRVLPQAGGWLDQDEALIADIMTMYRIYDAVAHDRLVASATADAIYERHGAREDLF